MGSLLLVAIVGALVRGCGTGGSASKGNLGAAWKADGDGTGALRPGSGDDERGSAQRVNKQDPVPAKSSGAGVMPEQTASVEEKTKTNRRDAPKAVEVVFFERAAVTDRQAPVAPAITASGAGASASPIVGTRGSPAGRDAARQRFGGSQAGEDAVLKALRWLKEKQERNGSWDGEGHPAAVTALGLLCFLAHGETPDSKEFGPTVASAIEFLSTDMQAGGIFRDGHGRRRNGCTYTHAIGTYGLAEAYNVTRRKDLAAKAAEGATVIVRGQNKAGGWDYTYGESSRCDTSIMGWQVQALKAVKLSGVPVDGMESCMQRAAARLKEHYKNMGKNSGGGFGYTGPALSGNLTPVGVLALMFLGEDKSEEVNGGLLTIDRLIVKWPQHGGLNVYGWYYATQTKFWEGGDAWRRWNANFAPAFILAQQPDGHWSGYQGDTLCTALACLSLEVYYRFLPTFGGDGGTGNEDVSGRVIGGAVGRQ